MGSPFQEILPPSAQEHLRGVCVAYRIPPRHPPVEVCWGHARLDKVNGGCLLQLCSSSMNECAVALLFCARSVIVLIFFPRRLVLPPRPVGLQLWLEFFKKREPYPAGTQGMVYPMLVKNILSRLKVLKCLFQYPIEYLFPQDDLPRAVCYHPVIPLQVDPWLCRASQINAVQDVALPSPQLLHKPVVERQKILISFYLWRLIRDHFSMAPSFVSILCDLGPCPVTIMFDPGPCSALSPYRKNPPEPRAVGVHDTSRRSLPRFITLSYKSHRLLGYVVPNLFVYALARVGKGKAFAPRIPCVYVCVS